jgi:hypothetical protein
MRHLPILHPPIVTTKSGFLFKVKKAWYNSSMTKTLKIICSSIAIILGALLFVYGGYDDSPGAQGLALVIVIAGIIGIVRSIRKKSV